MTHERTWRELTEEERADQCPTGGAIVWMVAGFCVMAIILLGVCFA